MRVVVAHSEDVDTGAAAAELIAQCDRALEDGEAPGAALLYAPPIADHELLLERIRARFPGIPLIGCSTDGVGSSTLPYRDESFAITLFVSEAVTFSAAVARNVSEDPEGTTERAVRDAARRLGAAPCLCIMFADALTTSGARLVAGARRGLGDDAIPIVGGFATDDWRFKKTYQYFSGELVGDSAPVLLMGGPLLTSQGVDAGWNPVGRTSRVTRVEGDVILEIDEKPALAFYQHYLGQHLLPSAEYPLAVTEVPGAPYYLRAPRAYDEASGSISFAGDIPAGAQVQLTETSRDDIVAACRRSVTRALEDYPGVSPRAALFFSCSARRMLLGSKTAHESETLTRLAKGMTVCGMYAFGEFGPLQLGGRSHFHNETFVTLIVGTE